MAMDGADKAALTAFCSLMGVIAIAILCYTIYHGMLANKAMEHGLHEQYDSNAHEWGWVK